jgi:hypothetical protein
MICFTVEETMSDVKDKFKHRAKDAVDATKKAGDKVVDKSKDVAKDAEKKLAEGRDRLRSA